VPGGGPGKGLAAPGREGMMVCRTHVEYYVEPEGRAWSVGFCGQHYGQYRTQREALDHALLDADHVGRLGQDIEVFVCGRNGAMHSAWTYSHDLQRMTRRKTVSCDWTGRIAGG
jgi:hypothetical protein